VTIRPRLYAQGARKASTRALQSALMEAQSAAPAAAGVPQLPRELADEAAHPPGRSRQEAARIAVARRRAGRFIRADRKEAQRLGRQAPIWCAWPRARLPAGRPVGEADT
jgi:hypothetical protein